AGIDALEHHDLHAGLFELRTNRGSNPLPVRLLVMKHGNGFGLDGFNDELRSSRTLLVIATDGAENHLVVLAVGYGRSSGGRGNHEDPFTVVNIRGGNGGA